MPNRLPVPADLQHLIEKRAVTDRRRRERRGADTNTTVGLQSITPPAELSGTADAEAAVEAVPAPTPARRKQADPRNSARRNSDKKKS
ncbi:MAG: hypothetical protein JWM11_2693 [Planctomycetaceae bacterium]|nr:hypothetical protein [Planctomycetaceae bacterium]